MQTFKDLYLIEGVLNRNEYQYCQKANHQTSMNPLLVLPCQFFKINYLHSSKNTLFPDSKSNTDS